MRLSKQFAVSLALAAMLLRALLPDGWMPASAGSGTPFVICSVDGVHTGGKGTPTQPSREHGPCAFASVAPLSPPALPAAVLGQSRDATRLARSDTATEFIPQPDYRPNAARAPPALS